MTARNDRRSAAEDDSAQVAVSEEARESLQRTMDLLQQLVTRPVTSAFEIPRPIKIGNQARLCGLPSDLFPRSRARRRAIERGEMREPAKVVGRLPSGLAHNRQVQAPADHGSDLPERHAFFCDAVISRTCGPALQHEPVQARSIKAMDRRPAIGSVADIRRYTLFARDADEGRNEPVVAIPMD